MSKPIVSTFPEFFSNYINLVNEDDLTDAFKKQQVLIEDFFENIPESKSEYAYAEGKWTLKELLQHIIDTERIFCYRALAIARKETVSLPGFDEIEYAANSNANDRDWKSLCSELKIVRRSTEILFSSFSAEAMLSTGLANNHTISVLAIGFTCIGHISHHINIIEERYL